MAIPDSTDDPDGPDARTRFDAVVARLAGLGVLKGRAAVLRAKGEGRSLALIEDIVDCYVKNRDTLSEGALVLRLEAPLIPGEHGASHWPGDDRRRPKKTAGFTPQDRADVDRSAATVAAQRVAGRAAADRDAELRREREARLGATLDATPIEQIHAMIHAAFGPAGAPAMLKRLSARGLAGSLRERLLADLERPPENSENALDEPPAEPP